MHTQAAKTRGAGRDAVTIAGRTLQRTMVLGVIAAAAALLTPAASAEAAGFSYAFAGPPSVTTPGSYTATLYTVASADGPLTVDVTALDGAQITGVADTGCAVTLTGMHCDLAVSAGVALQIAISGTYQGNVVHMRTTAADPAGPVLYAGDTRYLTVPANQPAPPAGPTPPLPPLPPLPPTVPPAPPVTAQPSPPAPSTLPPASPVLSKMPPTTWSAPSTSPPAALLGALRAKVLTWTNTVRAGNRLAALRSSAKLDQSAQKYAVQLAVDGSFTHTDGSVLTRRIGATGYRYHWVGENLGLGQTSPWAIVHAWMQSPDHRTNMLDKRFVDAGVGIAKRSDGQIIWCLDLGWPR